MAGSANDSKTNIYYIFYLVGLVILFFGYLFPTLRIWGVNHLAYQAVIFVIIFFTLFVICGFLLYRSKSDALDFKNQKLIFLIIAAVYPVLFYLLQVKTYFLGDGYQNLSLLEQSDPLIKFSAYGEGLAHLEMKNLLGGAESQALLSFKIISIGSGLLLILFIIYGAFKLFEKQFDRLAFVLGIGSGGYMLLSFGYVEHYSLFVLSVAMILVAGLLIVQNKMNRFIIIPLWLLSLFFHLFALTLLPAVIYLLYQNSYLSQKINRTITTAIVLALVISGAVMFGYFYSNYYFFKFAFIPLVSTRFTLNGYSLFSLNHLLDILNLLVMLSPGIIIFLALILKNFKMESLKKPELVFTLAGSLAAFGTVFILDPKLGMPRDWDLLSYSGIFIVGFIVSYLLFNREKLRAYKTVLSLIILLNFAFLFARAAAQHNEAIAIKHLKYYIDFDPVKNQSVYLPLIKYYSARGEKDTVEALRNERDQRFPDRLLNKEGLADYQAGNLESAMTKIKEALKYNPVNSGMYSNLALCVMELKLYDSALVLLKIADGLNPGNQNNYSNLGDCYYFLKDFRLSEEYYQKALSLNGNAFNALGGMMRLCQEQERREEFLNYFTRLANHPQATVPYIVSLARYYLQEGEREKAERQLNRALEKGLDTNIYNQLMQLQ